MQPFRAVLMLVAAGIAFYSGVKMQHGGRAWMAFGLGVLALGLAAWHWTRRRS
jgi:hypothetical protein